MKPTTLCGECGFRRDHPAHRTAIFPNAHEFVEPTSTCQHHFGVAIESLIDRAIVLTPGAAPFDRIRVTKLACTRGCGTLLPVKHDT